MMGIDKLDELMERIVHSNTIVHLYAFKSNDSRNVDVDNMSIRCGNE